MLKVGDIVKSSGNHWCEYEILEFDSLDTVRLKLHNDDLVPRYDYEEGEYMDEEYVTYVTQVGREYSGISIDQLTLV